MSNLGSLETLIEKAREGKLEYAQDLVRELAICFYKKQAVPQQLQEYFMPLLFQIAEGEEPKKALNLVRIGAPSLSFDRKCEIVEAVMSCVSNKGLTEEEAFYYLADEDNPEFLNLSYGRIRDLFYANIDGYLNVFHVPEGRYREKQLSNIQEYLNKLQAEG